MKHDLLHIQGKPFVLVPLHEYRLLTAGDDHKPGHEEEKLPDELLDRLYSGSESRVRILRKYRGLTQEELAAAVGLSRPYLTEIERGRKPGSVKTLRAIAQALEVNLRHLVG